MKNVDFCSKILNENRLWTNWPETQLITSIILSSGAPISGPPQVRNLVPVHCLFAVAIIFPDDWGEYGFESFVTLWLAMLTVKSSIAENFMTKKNIMLYMIDEFECKENRSVHGKWWAYPYNVTQRTSGGFLFLMSSSSIALASTLL